MTLPETRIEWEGLTLYGTRGPGRLTFRTLAGWEGFEGRTSMTDRELAHGAFDGPVLGNAKRVTVTGRAGSPTERDAILALLGDTFVPGAVDSVPRDLRITKGGRTLTAGARLLRYAPVVSAWGAGWFEWAAEWVCPDPIRYGDPVSVVTGFPEHNGGLHFPLFTNRQRRVGVLSYGARSKSGRATLINPGSAYMPALFQVTGPVPAEGFDLIAAGTGRRLRFVDPVAAVSTLVIDAATGLATVDGEYDRSGRLTIRDWEAFHVPPRGSLDVAFVPLGPSSTATLTAVSRPGWW